MLCNRLIVHFRKYFTYPAMPKLILRTGSVHT